jgi:hypothetical protein
MKNQPTRESMKLISRRNRKHPARRRDTCILATLRKALESSSAPESSTVAADEILKRINANA